MTPVALAFGVLRLTGSAEWLSAVTSAALVPAIATMLFGGGIADRYRRDVVLWLTSLGSGVAQTGIAVLLLTHQRPVWLLPFAAVNGVLQGLTTPALRGMIANLDVGRDLQQASSLLASAGNLARILGPTLAGLLTASAGGGWAIAADAASFFLAAACFARISLPRTAPRPERGTTMLAEMREGWQYFRSRPWIWSVTLAFAVFNGTNMGFWQILGPAIAVDTIGPRGWGLVLSARGVGALLSGLVLVRLPLMRHPMRPALSAMATATLPLLLLGLASATQAPATQAPATQAPATQAPATLAPATLALATSALATPVLATLAPATLILAGASFLAGVAAEFFTVVWETVNNTHIPVRLLSRTGAHDEFWSFVSLPAGQLSAPLLASHFGTAPVAVTGALIAATAMLLASLVPSSRRLEIPR